VFADMRAACDALDAGMKTTLEGLRVHHSSATNKDLLGFSLTAEQSMCSTPPCIRCYATQPQFVYRHKGRWGISSFGTIARPCIVHATTTI
jgi:hypothetical protein